MREILMKDYNLLKSIQKYYDPNKCTFKKILKNIVKTACNII